MKSITIFRNRSHWDLQEGGSFETFDAAFADAVQMAKRNSEAVEIGVAHCNRNTYAFDSDALPFVVAWSSDGVVVFDRALDREEIYPHLLQG